MTKISLKINTIRPISPPDPVPYAKDQTVDTTGKRINVRVKDIQRLRGMNSYNAAYNYAEKIRNQYNLANIRDVTIFHYARYSGVDLDTLIKILNE